MKLCCAAVTGKSSGEERKRDDEGIYLFPKGESESTDNEL